MTPALETLNAATPERALALLAPLVERSAWVAEATLDARPFRSDEEVAQALVETILVAGTVRRVALFRAHPELAGAEALEGRMTDASNTEQDRLGLLSLAPGQASRLAGLNASYRSRFGHPFIVALHRVPDLATLFEIFERRLAASPTEEHVSTLAEIASVIRARASAAFGPPDRPDASTSRFTENPQETIQ